MSSEQRRYRILEAVLRKPFGEHGRKTGQAGGAIMADRDSKTVPSNQTSDVCRDEHGHASGDRVCADGWPPRPEEFPELLTPVEAAQYLRLDETDSHSPESALRTLNYWRGKGQLKATKFARRVWYRRAELDRFLAVKTES